MIRNSLFKILIITLIVGLNWTGLSAVGRTFAYYSDNETSEGNLFQAALLDFSVTNRHIEGFIGMEALSEVEFASVVTKKTGSLNIQYEVKAETMGGNDAFCNALMMEVKHNGVKKHDGSLLSFSAPTTTQLGTWEFEIDLPFSATNVPHGAECNVDLVFKGWRTDVAIFEESGFWDEERIELRLTSRMIVLNEFLPNPNGLVPNYGFDFGDDADAMPKGEWVELYNNSDFDFDLSGYYLTDADGHRIDVEGCRTNTGDTIIPHHGFLVVYRKGGEDCTSHYFSLNNDGDTIKLFDNTDRLVDSYTYTTTSDYCEIEPTPGGENTEETSGSCAGVPPNKSYARIPDGIGFWVDPIPTPGGPNKLEEDTFEEEETIEEETTTTESETPSEENTIFSEMDNETGGEITEDVTTNNENAVKFTVEEQPADLPEENKENPVQNEIEESNNNTSETNDEGASDKTAGDIGDNNGNLESEINTIEE